MNARNLLLLALTLFTAATVAHAQEPSAPADADGDGSAEVKLQLLEERVQQLEKEMLEMRTSMLAMQNQLEQKDNEIAEILNFLTERDNEDQPILALRSIMKKSGEFRKEMAEAVNESIQRQGKLTVENQTAGVQFVAVNGRSERIEALETRVFTVPVGTLTTELIGQEGPKNWTITAPNYEQSIVIRPLRQRTVVESPVYIVP
jgi:TolA-binding protein